MTLCVLISFGGFIVGWDTGTIGGISGMPKFKETYGTRVNNGTYALDSWVLGLVISTFNIGCMFGGFFFGSIGDTWGRRVGIMSTAVILFFGLAVQIVSHAVGSWYVFMIGRIIAGFSAGGIAVLCPMLIGESAPSSVRGSFVVFYQVMMTLGILFGQITTFATKTVYANSATSYLVPICIGFGIGFILIIAAFVAPESARFLVKIGSLTQAKESLAQLSDTSLDSIQLLAEFDVLLAAHNMDAALDKTSFFEVLKPKYFLRIAIGCTIMALQQLTGINYFFYYGTSLFSAAGIEDSYKTAIILGTVNVISSFFGVPLVEWLGRKKCLSLGALSMAVCMVTYASVGTLSLTKSDDTVNAYAGIGMIIVTCLYIFSFAVSWGPVAFVVVSELYPLRIKSHAMAIATSTTWIISFLIALMTPTITNIIGYCFGYVFSGCLVFAFGFVMLIVKETKGLSLEQVEEVYSPRISIPTQA
ncbi:hypothetical protein BABINDRAFT_169770 [Babjeviella inositovora NRRL Y-12698]|uniref:Major facilitator superfamily (MFS) profile domain-containing protein n=1 Tax=Babjeviella inositovora NRRL Y-12698 TaxID=984486 RepID=A0A1E3QY08_9ASCO|nr:uncharacterized protein BABINDRAFT_169770 [Babjeviella inositovora NRRL Y-12698]ODQ82464.1 hypothetical protein BABINDRAFT_169770 [Babjeviella inositovora NRRL Y-12698]